MTGWWATAARALALILTLAIAAPVGGLAEDLAFHAGHRDHGRTGVVAVIEAGTMEMRGADPGLASHVHCDCHVAATLDGSDPAPALDASRSAAYAVVSEAVPAVAPERLPRPPRA